jgi:phage gpG-like protein
MAKVNIKGGKVTIPQRQFMGHTKALGEIQEKRVTDYFNKVWD